jgi:hypothetical protein
MAAKVFQKKELLNQGDSWIRTNEALFHKIINEELGACIHRNHSIEPDNENLNFSGRFR